MKKQQFKANADKWQGLLRKLYKYY